MIEVRIRHSPVLPAMAAGAAAAGIAAGIAQYLSRDRVVQAYVDGTSAWPAHLVLTACALAWIVAVGYSKRTGKWSPIVPINPIGRDAGVRWRTLLQYRPRTGAVPRLLASGLLTLIVVYGFWRAGEQIFGGLDPNFTVDAWGGPGYLGAMYCHYLDIGLIAAVCSVLLRATLPEQPATRANE